MKPILTGALGALLLALATTAIVLYAGIPNAAADAPHADVVLRLIEWTRERSIARRIVDITPPGDLADADRIRRGAGNYAAMCAECHLSPGAPDSEIRRGLYPVPPNFSLPATTVSNAEPAAARRFWIIKHGIKASGMPAWSKGGMQDAAIWDVVAFLGVLPSLSAAQYRQQVAASDGHQHGNMPQAMQPAIAPHHAHSAHGSKPHTHTH